MINIIFKKTEKMLKSQQILILALIITVNSTHTQNRYEDVFDKIKYYKNTFNLNCAKEKATDNRGRGSSLLYGTRNFRTILHGIAYRGGGNNYYHSTNKRNNKNPLPNDGLNNLANLNFDSAVYLYKINFETAPTSIKSENGTSLNYYQISGNNNEEVRRLLEMTHESILEINKGPIYLHCWNGWHQSGYVSALLLRQFCDLGPEEAVYYWQNNTDTWNNGYDRIKSAIRDFVPYEDMKIDNNIKQAICPCLDKMPDKAKMEISEKEKLKSTLLTKVPFANNSTEILPGSLTAIDEYILLSKENYFFDIEIGGHTSSTGSKQYNQTISEKRAKIVYDYLIKSGIESDRLTYRGYGEDMLIDLNNNDEAHTKNRRIEFKVTGINLELQFQKNQYELPAKNLSKLFFIAELLAINSDKKLLIEGHTDNTGNLEFNKNLSNLRAKSVYNFMLDQGIQSDRLSYVGFGPTAPRYSNETKEGRQKNRRIEIKLE